MRRRGFLALPAGLAFTFAGVTRNGAISTDFEEALTREAGTVRGAVGDQPGAAVTVETKNGDIRVTRTAGAK